ncbi:MAG: hypothetical protein WKF70_14780 [Chitinophagaceae bacterium]
MSKYKYTVWFSGLILLYFLSTGTGGCAKEYSYERTVQDSAAITTPDTLQPLIPACPLCVSNNTIVDSSWIFTLEKNVLCGRVEKTIITLERGSFTFFGASSCSADSGFIATVFLTEPLDRDKQNIPAARVAVYYYDAVKPSYILMSKAAGNFALNIDNYDHSSGRATGTFTGFAYTETGLGKLIEKGRFNIRFNL